MAHPERRFHDDRNERTSDDTHASRQPENRSDEYGNGRYRGSYGTLSSPRVGGGEPMDGGYFTGSDRNYGGGQSNYGAAGSYDDWGDRRNPALDAGHELSDFGGPLARPGDRHSQPTGSRDAPHRAGDAGVYRDEGDRPSQKHVDWDADYHRWRTEQIRTLDNDYAEWRRDRYRKFSEEFDGWRRARVQAGETAVPADDKGGADDRASSLTPKK